LALRACYKGGVPITFRVVTALAGLCLTAGAASAQTQAVMTVGAFVSPHCQITVGARPDDAMPAVTASGAASALRRLQVSTDRGHRLDPIGGRRRARAGGDAVYVVTREMVGGDGKTALVTLDF